VNGQTANSQIDNADRKTFIHFVPDSFYNKFSFNISPVLHIHSGDTISTETIDAMGFDHLGVKRQKGGNPLTGPFYIEEAREGDVLQIKLISVALNRTYAYTTEAFVSRSMPSEIADQFKKLHLVKWKLDPENNTGWPDSSSIPYEHLKDFKIPLNPFLGCIGVAPQTKNNEIRSFFQGNFGGNMDFSGVRQSAIVYLPVFHDGGFLFMGDGHAAQGDGEIAGNALETSLNVEFSVKVKKKEIMQLSYPRVEDSVFLMSVGVAKKIDLALQSATEGLLNWLQYKYQLSMPEATQVMSTSIEYTVAEIADPEVIVVAKIKKSVLEALKVYSPTDQ
jgi:amidase